MMGGRLTRAKPCPSHPPPRAPSRLHGNQIPGQCRSKGTRGWGALLTMPLPAPALCVMAGEDGQPSVPLPSDNQVSLCHSLPQTLAPPSALDL